MIIIVVVIHSLFDVEECIAGAEGGYDGSDQSLLLTIIAKIGSGSRVVVLRMNNKEERNTVLSKLRYDHINKEILMALLKMSIMPHRALASAEKLIIDENSKTIVPLAGKKKVSFDEQSKSKGDTSAADGNMIAVQNVSAQRATRRLSVRETILEENLANTHRRSGLETTEVAKKTEQTYNVKELLHQLREEKEHSEKLKMQVGVFR